MLRVLNSLATSTCGCASAAPVRNHPAARLGRSGVADLHVKRTSQPLALLCFGDRRACGFIIRDLLIHCHAADAPQHTRAPGDRACCRDLLTGVRSPHVGPKIRSGAPPDGPASTCGDSTFLSRFCQCWNPFAIPLNHQPSLSVHDLYSKLITVPTEFCNTQRKAPEFSLAMH